VSDSVYVYHSSFFPFLPLFLPFSFALSIFLPFSLNLLYLLLLWLLLLCFLFLISFDFLSISLTIHLFIPLSFISQFPSLFHLTSFPFSFCPSSLSSFLLQLG
jgi:hypothetical protein